MTDYITHLEAEMSWKADPLAWEPAMAFGQKVEYATQQRRKAINEAKRQTNPARIIAVHESGKRDVVFTHVPT